MEINIPIPKVVLDTNSFNGKHKYIRSNSKTTTLICKGHDYLFESTDNLFGTDDFNMMVDDDND